LNRLTSNYITPCRRRTDDTRRVLLVITVECLFAILNSWFSDILISVVYCKGTLLADGDCPGYLQANYDLLVMFDMFNSISNIVLYCLCSKHFRYELYRMFNSIYYIWKSISNHFCCFTIQFKCQKNFEQSTVCYRASAKKIKEIDHPSSSSSSRVVLKVNRPVNQPRNPYFDCRWYFNHQQFTTPKEWLSKTKEYILNQRTTSLPTHRVGISSSMRIYFPPEHAGQLL